MQPIAILSAGILLASALSAQAQGAPNARRQPVVVELFTSQGCSSCPPANANLIALSRRPDVLALSFSVTYWDYLGWKDVFGKPQFTERQVTYEPKLGQNGPFTPQMVVNGRESTIGYDLAEVESLVARNHRQDEPSISLGAGRIVIGAGPTRSADADVWLVQYDPGIVEVPVRRGENTGRTLPHGHVVHELARLGGWNGRAATYALPTERGGLKTAILVQERDGGPILAAATME